ncbi:MAG TPA: type II secretion system protein [Candidatus Pacearchaeota archaeon]|nr:type II secretion system protein [Candidatus Pacearchaeota archaeon]
MKNRGFTLIEAVVSLAIFIAISSALAEIIVISIQNQIKITSVQSMFNQAIFSLDKMEKELRMAKKDAAGSCVGTKDKNYSVSGNSIIFLYNDQETKTYKCKKFVLEAGKIKEYVSSNATAASFPAIGVDMTTSSINVDSLKFNVHNDVVGDSNQPKVVIAMTVSPKNVQNQTPIKLQTTISQRRLDL